MAAGKAKSWIFICSARALNLNICCRTGGHLQLHHCTVSADRHPGSCCAKSPRWEQRVRTNRESQTMDKKLFLCPSASSIPPPIGVRFPPPLPLSPFSGLSTFSAAMGTVGVGRLVGDSGRFLCFCLGLSLSLRLCKRNQRALEGLFFLC